MYNTGGGQSTGRDAFSSLDRAMAICKRAVRWWAKSANGCDTDASFDFLLVSTKSMTKEACFVFTGAMVKHWEKTNKPPNGSSVISDGDPSLSP